MILLQGKMKNLYTIVLVSMFLILSIDGAIEKYIRTGNEKVRRMRLNSEGSHELNDEEPERGLNHVEQQRRIDEKEPQQGFHDEELHQRLNFQTLPPRPGLNDENNNKDWI